MTQVSGDVLSFGPFTLRLAERLLARGDVPVDLGSRAFDILAVLASRPNETVDKRELLQQVWPDVTVEEGSLRFHVTNLRKALGDGRDGARYISTLPGRGYCFVAPITRSDHRSTRSTETAANWSRASLPGRLLRMIGRTDDIGALTSLIAAKRFVTIVGTGGVGKTTVAVAAGHNLADRFEEAVHFIDLGALSDPSHVATTIASVLGLSIPTDEAIPALVAYLADKRTLLILDTCEHVIDAAACIASRIFAEAPEVHVMATSREPLHVEGEHLYKLAPLDCPPDEPDITAANAIAFPATELFLERAAAGGADLDLDDAEAAIVASICRKLDGVPLAIELVAGRIASYGVGRTAELLEEQLAALWPGQRTAPPRQKTLQATLDWSYGQLSELEQLLLRRLAVFVGHFSLDAALSVASDNAIPEPLVFEAFDNLITKSMVSTRPAGATMRYRLLDTTRTYALHLDNGGTAVDTAAERHAMHYLRWLEESGPEWPALSSARQRALHLDGMANVRAALEWSFGPRGNKQLGVRLATAAAPVLLSMSLLVECHRWCGEAILALDDADHYAREEMCLQAGLGVSLMFMRGGTDEARVALERSFVMAEQSGCALDQLEVLAPLQMFHLRRGEFRTALRYAERCSRLAEALNDQTSATLAYSLMGISLHLSGELNSARTALEAALLSRPNPKTTTANYLGFDGRILAGAILARTLWLQGLEKEAIERSIATVEEAKTLNHPLTHCIALVWAVSVFLWADDVDRAETSIKELLRTAERHSLRPYIVVGRGFQHDLAIRRGDTSAGIEGLRSCVSELHATPYELLNTQLVLMLLEGLLAAKETGEALRLCDETISAVRTNGDLCYLPELMHLRTRIVLAEPHGEDRQATAIPLRSTEFPTRIPQRSPRTSPSLGVARHSA